MARPIKHDGGLYKREGSAIWWMQYRDKIGVRQRESTGTEDWDEAQRSLRERLQARDNNTLPALRRGSDLVTGHTISPRCCHYNFQGFLRIRGRLVGGVTQAAG